MISVVMGNNAGKDASRPFANLDKEDFGTYEQLVEKAKSLGVETNLVSEEGAAKVGQPVEPCPHDLLVSRVQAVLRYKPHPGNLETHIGCPHDDMMMAMREITPVGGIWEKNSLPGAKPLWIESSSPGLATLLSEFYATVNPDGTKTFCPIGRPADWKADHAPV